MDSTATIWVAGADTLIGQALIRRLVANDCRSLVGLQDEHPDLHDRSGVERFLARTCPAYVFVVGPSAGIGANQRYPVDLMQRNLLAACHVLDSAYRHGAEKLLYLASSCTYPKHCPQPMRVDTLLSGPLEPTSAPFAVAKIAGILLCQAYRRQHKANFISAIPADAFGPGDDFSAEDSHVVGALLRKMHHARLAGAPTVEIWGTGTPRREFIFCDDLADACILAMQSYDGDHPINLGGGDERSISELAALIRDVVGYRGELVFDRRRPDGMPRKLLDSGELIALGWRPRTPLREALIETYRWFLQIEKGGTAE